MINLTVKKSIDSATAGIDYVFSNDGGKIEWDTWGFQTNTAHQTGIKSCLKKQWIGHLLEKKRRLLIARPKGRSFIRTAYHLVMSDGILKEYSSPYKKTILSLIKKEFDDYRGIVCFHYKDVVVENVPIGGIHCHLLVHPVHVARGTMLDLRQDVIRSIQNRYIMIKQQYLSEFLDSAEAKRNMQATRRVLSAFVNDSDNIEAVFPSVASIRDNGNGHFDLDEEREDSILEEMRLIERRQKKYNQKA